MKNLLNINSGLFAYTFKVSMVQNNIGLLWLSTYEPKKKNNFKVSSFMFFLFELKVFYFYLVTLTVDIKRIVHPKLKTFITFRPFKM